MLCAEPSREEDCFGVGLCREEEGRLWDDKQNGVGPEGNGTAELEDLPCGDGILRSSCAGDEREHAGAGDLFVGLSERMSRWGCRR